MLLKVANRSPRAMPTINETINKSTYKKYKPRAADLYIRDKKTKGFFIRVRPSGTTTYGVQGSHFGQKKRPTIANCNVMDVNEARQEAEECLKNWALGKDPKAEKRRKASQKNSLLDMLEEYRKARSKLQLRTTTYERYKYTLSHYMKGLSSRPITSLTVDDFLDWHQSKDSVPTSRARAFTTARTLLRFAKAKGYIEEDAGTQAKAILGQDVIKSKIPRYISLNNISDFVGALIEVSPFHPQQKKPPTNSHLISQTARDYILFLLVTGLRKSEATNLRWKDVDFETNTFDIPYNKAGRHMRVPMTRLTKDLLLYRYNCPLGKKQIDKHPVHVFPNKIRNGGYSNPRKALGRISSLANFNEDISPHDLRRTFATYCKELGYSISDTGKLLNHANRNVTENYVQRELSTQRRMYDGIIRLIEDQLQSTVTMDGDTYKVYGVYNGFRVYFYNANVEVDIPYDKPEVAGSYWDS